MDVTTTQQNDWLLYYYNECGMLDSDRIQRGIDGDPNKASEYLEMTEQLDALTVPLPEPSDDCIRRILAMA
jgi:hypothetical protein